MLLALTHNTLYISYIYADEHAFITDNPFGSGGLSSSINVSSYLNVFSG